MAWVPISNSVKTPSTPTWEELAKLEEASPGLTRLPPGRLVTTHGMRAIKKPLAKDMLVQVLSEAGIGRKKRSIVLRKIEHAQFYGAVKVGVAQIISAHDTAQAKPAKKERAIAGDVD